MSLWTRIRARSNLPYDREDWIVVYAGRWRVARITFQHAPHGEDYWSWGTQTHPAQHGSVASIEEAQNLVKAAVVIGADGVPVFPGPPDLYDRFRRGSG